ncbi:hypothetical protein [Streptosporangium sandarakinum]
MPPEYGRNGPRQARDRTEPQLCGVSGIASPQVTTLTSAPGPFRSRTPRGSRDGEGGEGEAEAQVADQVGGVGDEGTEHGDGEGAAELAAGVEHAAGDAGPGGGHAGDEVGGGGRHGQWAAEAERAGDLLAAYARLMSDPDPAVRAKAAHDRAAWEDAVISLEVNGRPNAYSDRPQAGWLMSGGELIGHNDPGHQEKVIKFNESPADCVIYSTACDITDVADAIAAEGHPVDPDDPATISPHITHTVRRFGNRPLDLTPPAAELTTRPDLECRVLFAP